MLLVTARRLSVLAIALAVALPLHGSRAARAEATVTGPSNVLLDAPALISPADGATGIPDFMYLDWQMMPGATSYELAFVSPDGTDQINTGGQNWLHRYDLEDGVTYGWRVRAHGSGSVVSPWSETRSFTVSSNAERFGMSMRFSTVANAAGPVEPPVMAAFAFNGTGFPMTGGSDRPDASAQTNGSTWGLHAATDEIRFGPPTDSTSFLAVISDHGESLAEIFGSDYEIRFTATGGVAELDGDGSLISVPFELWNVGDGTFADATDDIRMIPVVHDQNANGVFDISGDHAVSGNTNDPHSDWITWHMPIDTTPGSDGYNAFASGTPESFANAVFHKLVLVNWNGGQQPPYDADLPEPGTVIRIESGDEDIAPINAAPPDMSTVDAGPVSFYWADQGARARTLQVASDDAFLNVVFEQDVSGRTGAVTILADGLYYWRVSSGPDSWSEPWAIQVRNGSAVSVDESQTRQPEPLLLQSFPNPANEAATISFELPERSFVDLAVYDLLGRRVLTVVEGELSAGIHERRIDVADLTTGSYFYRMAAGSVTQTRLLTVTR